MLLLVLGNLTPPKFNIEPESNWFLIEISFSGGPLSGSMLNFRGVIWVVPPPSKSHHQDYSIFSRESQPKPSFPLLLGGGTTQGVIIFKDAKSFPMAFMAFFVNLCRDSPYFKCNTLGGLLACWGGVELKILSK